MFCSKCGTKIPEGSAACPNCGNPVELQDNMQLEVQPQKKGGKLKKILIGLGIALVIFLAIGMLSSPEETADADDIQAETVDNTTAENAQENNETEDSDSPAAMYEWVMENATTPFNITEQAMEFINAHPDFFPGDESIEGAMSDFIDWDLTYPMLSKSADKYGDCLYSSSGYVVDIEEVDSSLTYLQVMDIEGNNYVIYYLGILADVYEQDEVMFYALPLDVVTFENMGGTYTEAIAMAGSYVNKLNTDPVY